MPGIPLDLRGTPFQRAVWTALREIPPGRTQTYGQVAARIGRPGAARAVARACAANPGALLVPCHRVVPAAGGSGGWRWGAARKRLLLAQQLLARGCTPAEAAAQAGYQDYSTFSRAYKKQFGHGPSADTKGKQQDLQITTQEF